MDTALSPHRHSVHGCRHCEGIILAASRRLSALWPKWVDGRSMGTHTHTHTHTHFETQSQWSPLGVKRWLDGPVGLSLIRTVNCIPTHTHINRGLPLALPHPRAKSKTGFPTGCLWDTPLGWHTWLASCCPSRILTLGEMDTHFDTPLQPSGSHSPNLN